MNVNGQKAAPERGRPSWVRAGQTGCRYPGWAVPWQYAACVERLAKGEAVLVGLRRTLGAVGVLLRGGQQLVRTADAGEVPVRRAVPPVSVGSRVQVVPGVMRSMGSAFLGGAVPSCCVGG